MLHSLAEALIGGFRLAKCHGSRWRLLLLSRYERLMLHEGRYVVQAVCGHLNACSVVHQANLDAKQECFQHRYAVMQAANWPRCPGSRTRHRDGAATLACPVALADHGTELFAASGVPFPSCRCMFSNIFRCLNACCARLGDHDIDHVTGIAIHCKMLG